LSRVVQVTGVAWRAATRIVTRIGDGCTGWVLDGWAIERSGGAVCGIHRARGDEKHEFLG
jgi:hypothetical protein